MRSLGMIVLLALVAGVAACGGASEATSERTAAASTPTAHVDPPTQDSNDQEVEGESSKPVLPEGISTQSGTTYTTDWFTPRMTFRSPPSAYPFFPEVVSERVILLNTESGSLFFANPAKIFDPKSGKLVPAGGDLLEWATSNPHVEVGSPQPVTIGGAKGSEVQGAVVSAPGKAPECDQACLRFTPMGSDDSIYFWRGDRFRFISVNVKGADVAIIVASDKAGFGQAKALSSELLKTLRFH
jgi:hypothetical protein